MIKGLEAFNPKQAGGFDPPSGYPLCGQPHSVRVGYIQKVMEGYVCIRGSIVRISRER